MSRDNIIKLSIAGVLLVVALVVIYFTVLSGPRVTVNEDVATPEMGTSGNTRGPSEDY